MSEQQYLAVDWNWEDLANDPSISDAERQLLRWSGARVVENERLRAENARLAGELVALKAERASWKEEVVEIQTEYEEVTYDLMAEHDATKAELERVKAAAKMVLNGLDHITYTGSEEAALLMDTAWAQLDRVLRGPGKDWEEEQGA